MDKPPTGPPPSTSAIRKAQAPMSVASLMAHVGAGTTPVLFDLREAPAFHARHIPGSQNAPNSQPTALVRKLQTVEKALLICDDGKLSALVARTLVNVKINSVISLEGGLEAWVKYGGKLAETTRSGFEHELPPPPKVDESAKGPVTRRWLNSIKGLFKEEEDK